MKSCKRLMSAITAAVMSAVTFCACGSFTASARLEQADASPSKSITNGNPLISNVFYADPTAVEYEGRLYVYGTNGSQQLEAVGKDGENTYEHIKSLVVLSTDDMANWTYHGTIDVESISPWIIASWAPSIVSRVEDDGETHFYMYYSNSGWGVGVLTATSPLGPWTDPLGTSIVDGNTKGFNGCQTPFDPGVVIDDDGVGWLSFGGGTDSARIVRLGEDMISLGSEIVSIPSPYHFEASELNYINGTYVYTYNNSWDSRIEWDEDAERSPKCSMAYLTTTTPLDSDSWEYRDWYFKNPGEYGLEYSNNHTHLQKYNGKYYLFYHSLFPQAALGISGGFRSLCVNEIEVDEENVVISQGTATKEGVEQIKSLDVFEVNQAETMRTSLEICYNSTDTAGNMTVSAESDGGWIYVSGADFGDGAKTFHASAKGSGYIEIYLDDLNGRCAASVKVDSKNFAEVQTKLSKIKGEHDIYFVLSEGVEFDEWIFE